MSARKPVLPMLSWALEIRGAGGLTGGLARKAARAELRAAKAVIRALDRVKPYTPGWQERVEGVFRAKARLDALRGKR